MDLFEAYATLTGAGEIARRNLAASAGEPVLRAQMTRKLFLIVLEFWKKHKEVFDQAAFEYDPEDEEIFYKIFRKYI